MRWLDALARKAKPGDEGSVKEPMAADARAPAEWWAKGAERGDADSQAMLGAAFHLGAGVPCDAIAAFALLLQARKGGSALASPFFDAVRGTLTSIELEEAEMRVSTPLAPVAT